MKNKRNRTIYSYYVHNFKKDENGSRDYIMQKTSALWLADKFMFSNV